MTGAQIPVIDLRPWWGSAADRAAVGRQIDAAVLGGGLVQLDHMLKYALQPHRLEEGDAVTPFDLADALQGAEAGEQFVCFGQRPINHFPLGTRQLGLLADPIEQGAQAVQRRAQVVRDVLADALDLP